MLFRNNVSPFKKENKSEDELSGLNKASKNFNNYSKVDTVQIYLMEIPALLSKIKANRKVRNAIMTKS